MSQIGSGGGWSEIGSDLILVADDLSFLLGEGSSFQPTIPLLPPDEFAGNSDGNSACSADFGGVRMVAGNSDGASTVSASFGGVKGVAGGSVGASTVSGNFGGVKTLSGGSVGASTVSGAFNGVKTVVGGSAGASTCTATFTAVGPAEPARGADRTFKPNRWDPDKTPRDAKLEKKHEKPHPVRAKRKLQDAKPDFSRAKDYFDVPYAQPPAKPLPVAYNPPPFPSVPMGRVQFAKLEPGVGRSEMDALMATLAALEAEPDINGLKEEFFQSMPEEDLELVLLADEITS